MAEKIGHDVSILEAAEDYITSSLGEYKMDPKAIQSILDEADSGVMDDYDDYHAGG